MLTFRIKVIQQYQMHYKVINVSSKGNDKLLLRECINIVLRIWKLYYW